MCGVLGYPDGRLAQISHEASTCSRRSALPGLYTGDSGHERDAGQIQPAAYEDADPETDQQCLRQGSPAYGPRNQCSQCDH